MRPGAAVKGAVAASAAVHLGAVVALVVLRLLADGAVGDRLGVVPLAAVYGLPAVLAALAFVGRPQLLVAAGIATLVLALFPFSLHSFVLGPVGIAYLVAAARWQTPSDGRGGAVAAGVVPLLLVGAFVALLWHEDPICYTKDASGQVTVDRDPGPLESGSQTIGPDSDVVEGGCSGDTVVWWEALTSLALSGGALAAAILLTGPSREPVTSPDGPGT